MCVEGTFYAMFGGLFIPMFLVLLHPMLTAGLQETKAMTEPPPIYTTRPSTRPQLRQAPIEAMIREEMEKLERQLIPTINTIQAALGKPPIIVPKR